ncbi:MAG TPA: efflux RND transporter periplasmic adaptor subunit [Xanthobacteraceae bacterium]|nr:efflux RND transporter periplasmic adaptor subunit [Xanthobacteraceae bacterium]
MAAASLALSSPSSAQTGGSAGQPPAPAVVYITVQEQELNQSGEFIARVQAIESVDLRAQVSGTLQQVAFEGGQDVKKGALLYVIEPGLYEAALASAQAQLQSAQASLIQAQQNLDRQQQLFEHRTAAESTLEQARAQRDVAQANVKAAQAQVNTAQINLGYTRITSPIDGRIGATAVTQGNLVGPTTGTLATVVQLDPIRVVYSVNERDLVGYRQAHPNATQEEMNARFIPKLRLADGSMFAETGHVAFVDNRVDPSTGTVAVYADFPNPKRLLLPGMLATAVITPETPATGFLVPAGAIQQDNQGRYVLVVGPDNRVQRRTVETGPQIQQSVAVTSGLNNGDQVIIEGAQKVRPGQVVNAVPESSSPTPPSRPAPSAGDSSPESQSRPGR